MQSANNSSSNKGLQSKLPICREVPVTIQGLPGSAGSSGQRFQFFTENTTTVIVFDTGAVLRIRSGAQCGQRLVLTNREHNKETLCRVVCLRSGDAGQGYAEVEFLQTALGFWGAALPVQTATRPASGAEADKAASGIAEAQTATKAPAAGGAARQEAARPAAGPADAVVPVSSKQECQPARASVAGSKKISAAQVAPRTAPVGEELKAAIPAAPTESVETMALADALGPVPMRIRERARRALEKSVAAGLQAEAGAHQEENPAGAATSAGAGSSEPGGAAQPLCATSPVFLNWRERRKPEQKPSTKVLSLALCASAMGFFINSVVIHSPGLAFAQELLGTTSSVPTASIAATPARASRTMQSGTQADMPAAGMPAGAEQPSTRRAATEAAPAAMRAESNAGQSEPEAGKWRPAHSAAGVPRTLMPQSPRPAREISSSEPPPEAAAAPETFASGGEISLGQLAGAARQPAAPVEEARAKEAETVKLEMPRLLRASRPVYPAMARAARVEGDVVIEATIEETGRVGAMEVVSGPAALRQAAKDALATWKYEPARRNGQKVGMKLLVTVRFRLQ
jgi:protein TonB